MLLPIVLLVAPAMREAKAVSPADSAESVEAPAAAPPEGGDRSEASKPHEVRTAAITPAAEPATPLRANVLRDLHIPSRIAWTVDVGGQPVTFVPARPSGGFKLTVELDF